MFISCSVDGVICLWDGDKNELRQSTNITTISSSSSNNSNTHKNNNATTGDRTSGDNNNHGQQQLGDVTCLSYAPHLCLLFVGYEMGNILVVSPTNLTSSQPTIFQTSHHFDRIDSLTIVPSSHHNQPSLLISSSHHLIELFDVSCEHLSSLLQHHQTSSNHQLGGNEMKSTSSSSSNNNVLPPYGKITINNNHHPTTNSQFQSSSSQHHQPFLSFDDMLKELKRSQFGENERSDIVNALIIQYQPNQMKRKKRKKKRDGGGLRIDQNNSNKNKKEKKLLMVGLRNGSIKIYEIFPFVSPLFSNYHISLPNPISSLSSFTPLYTENEVVENQQKEQKEEKEEEEEVVIVCSEDGSICCIDISLLISHLFHLESTSLSHLPSSTNSINKMNELSSETNNNNCDEQQNIEKETDDGGNNNNNRRVDVDVCYVTILPPSSLSQNTDNNDDDYSISSSSSHHHQPCHITINSQVFLYHIFSIKYMNLLFLLF